MVKTMADDIETTTATNETSPELFKDELTKPALQRLALQAGIKIMSIECFPVIRGLILTEIDDICRRINILNSQHNTTTIMLNDLENAIKTKGVRIATSSAIGDSSCGAI